MSNKRIASVVPPWSSSAKLRRKRRSSARRGVVAFSALLASLPIIDGCARVTVRKVPTPTQYHRWTDKMQRQADGMEGFRFYLPRPFVQVFESFPVRTDVYLANGVVSPDGAYVIVTELIAEADFGEYRLDKPVDIRIPVNYIEAPKADRKDVSAPAEEGPVTPQGQGALLDAAAKAIGERLESKFDAILHKQGAVLLDQDRNEPRAGLAEKHEPGEKTGVEERRVTNDNMAYAYQPLRGNFDMVYLPDFDEQYVVSSRSALGNVAVEVNLGQGWSLQGFNSLVDNSELNRRIFDMIDSSVQLAKSAAYAAAGFPFPAVPAEIAPQGAGARSLVMTPGTTLEAEAPRPATPVSLKIVAVHYAAKGLYPVIKPRELQERTWPGGEWEERIHNNYCFLDLFKLHPHPTYATEIDPGALVAARRATTQPAGHFTIPRYPYQYVSFNTFRYLAIEAIRPTTSQFGPFEHLYDATGVSGDHGMARPGIPPQQSGEPGGAQTPRAGGNLSQPHIAAWDQAIKGQDIRRPALAETNYYAVEGLRAEGDKIVVSLARHGDPPPLEQLEQELIEAILDNSVDPPDFAKTLDQRRFDFEVIQ